MRTMERVCTIFVAALAFGCFEICGFNFGDTGGQHVFPTTPKPPTPTPDPDLEVRQFFDTLCEERLNDQIEEELKASHLYLSMSYFFSRADVALFGFHKFFKKMSDEERGHAQMLMEYVNKRGGTVTMDSSLTFHRYKELSSGDWNSALHAMKTAMKMEHHVNRHLKERVHKCAMEHDDFHLQDYIESHFLTEQVDSIKQIGDYITKMERLGTGIGLHMFDKELQD